MSGVTICFLEHDSPPFPLFGNLLVDAEQDNSSGIVKNKALLGHKSFFEESSSPSCDNWLMSDEVSSRSGCGHKISCQNSSFSLTSSSSSDSRHISGGKRKTSGITSRFVFKYGSLSCKGKFSLFSDSLFIPGESLSRPGDSKAISGHNFLFVKDSL